MPPIAGSIRADSLEECLADLPDHGERGKSPEHRALVRLVCVAETQELLAAATDAAGRAPPDLERRIDGGHRSQCPRPIRYAAFVVQGAQSPGWSLQASVVEPMEVEANLRIGSGDRRIIGSLPGGAGARPTTTEQQEGQKRMGRN